MSGQVVRLHFAQRIKIISVYYTDIQIYKYILIRALHGRFLQLSAAHRPTTIIANICY